MTQLNAIQLRTLNGGNKGLTSVYSDPNEPNTSGCVGPGGTIFFPDPPVISGL
ncbi:MAG: hypothetical protein AAF828_09665 [Bacteroidota bacterium]